ncbi:MAG: hypothetical protein SGILL_008862 [Bacillariaceae sp.]
MPSYPYDDDDFTTDSGTVATKALITSDGKCPKHPSVTLRGRDNSGNVFQQDSCPECVLESEEKKQDIRLQQQELEKAMRNLENQSIGGGSSSERSSTQSKYRPPAPLPTGPPQYYQGPSGGGFPYPPPPMMNGGYPGYPPMMNGGAAGSENGSASAASRAPPPPFNPYDPYGMASMTAHLQQKLEEKEEELKAVRKTLEETQGKLQEETLNATRLHAKLDQAMASFESERQLIELQAEKKAQAQIQVQQQEIFQKQLELMDTWQKGGGVGAAPVMIQPLAPMDEPPPPKAQERPRPEVVARSSSLESQERKAPPPATAAAAKTVENQTRSIKSGTSDTEFHQSTDTSLVNSAEIDYDDDDDSEVNSGAGHPVAPPNTPAQRQDVPSFSNLTTGSRSQKETSPYVASGSGNGDVKAVGSAQKESSDHFTPIYPKPNEPEPEQDGDDITLGQTVASSTYGEDRIKVVEKELLDPYGDKGTYTGVVLRTTGMPHGLGRMIYEEDGRIYQGDWRHGRWHGFGTASFSNGDSYEGGYRFDQRHGNGKYKWHDGRIYDGEFLEDKRHGKGKFTWPDGAIYIGDFVNGQREGEGKYIFADGGQYEGAWKDGRYEGYGTCTWEDGRRYQGEWRNGMAHGKGIETYPNGNVRHEGMWDDDEPIR